MFASRATASRKLLFSRLFQFRVVAGENLLRVTVISTVAEFWLTFNTMPSPNDFARQVVPFVALWIASEPVHPVLISSLDWHRFGARTLVPEDTEIVANLDALAWRPRFT